MTRQTLTIPIVLAVVVVPALAQAPNLRPGKYEITAQMESPGMKMRPHKGTQCITAEQLKDVSKAFRDREMEKECKVSDVKVDGNKVTFRTTCKQDGIEAIGNTEVTLGTDSYTALVTTKDNKGHTMTITQNAKRIGECTK